MATLTPQAFAKRWGESTLSERSSYQQHFLDLCEVLGAPRPAETDPAGEFYTFEKGVEMTGGGKGFADVWYKDHFAIEYKGKHKDLSAAYQQLLQYRESLESPPLLAVTDIDRFEIRTNFTGTVTQVYAFTNTELPEPENLRVLKAMFADPYSLKPTRTVESVTEEAAAKFARLADGLRSRGEEPHRVAHFLMKLVFCLFAEDVGLLQEKIFTKLVDSSVGRPERFPSRARQLFSAMAEGGEVNWQQVRHFNGGLFADDDALSLTREEIRVLVETVRLDWSSVEPAIFGTLFERSIDPQRRSQLGAQYTSKEDILRIVEPVLIAPFRREWHRVQEEVEALMATEHPDFLSATRGAALAARTRSVNRVLREAQAKLDAFTRKLREVRVLDPACGSGNFLYVSLNELLDLEKEAAVLAGQAGLGTFVPEVSPNQLYGIEVDPYARELTQVSIWIGYLQWLAKNGFGSPDDPILGPMTSVPEMDAILERGEDGTLREPDWPDADVIVGNPPFLGDKKMRAELGDEYVEQLRKLYAGRVPGGADLVTYWFEKARAMLDAKRAKRLGLIATQGIRGGRNREVLKRIKKTGNIFMAWSDREWVLNGASVHVSIVGFDGGMEKERVLNGVPVENINSDLTGALDFTETVRLPENTRIAFQGPVMVGAFDIDAATVQDLLQRPNPHGRPNSEVIFPFINAADITGRRRGWHIIDFGQRTEEEASLYEAPFEYVKQHVKPQRARNRRENRRKNWWRHGEPGTNLRVALAGKRRKLVTPLVSKHRIFLWVDVGIVANQTVNIIALEDDYSFGVLQSKVHELWARRTGTQLREVESGFRYTPTTCFGTFPFPHPSEEQQEEISEAARRLDELRRNWLNPEGAAEAELKKRTLTNLYNQRPTWLANAHARLDAAVFVAYGWPSDLSDEAVLQNLLALNLERSNSG
jgi:type II restriction/modification system DNA methylase subunit YeeA